MRQDKIHTKDRKTGKNRSIIRHNLQIVDWGISFLVEKETDAFIAAYLHQNKFGTRVEYSISMGMYLVTIFNEFADKTGINK